MKYEGISATYFAERALMSGFLLWIAIFIWAISILLWGFVSVLSPPTLHKFFDWYNRADEWSKPKRVGPNKSSLNGRIAGVFGILIGGWMLCTLLSHRTQPVRYIAAPIGAAYSSTFHHWSELIGGLVITALGIYMLLRPQINLRLTQANFPNRELSPDAIRTALRGGRILGILSSAFGLFLLFLWAGWMH